MTVDQVRQATIEVLKASKVAAALEDFAMDLAKAQYKELPNGTTYVLVPTMTVIAAKDKRYKIDSFSLALMDAGKWYIVRISDIQQLTMVREMYPEFVGVEFPQGTMEILESK